MAVLLDRIARDSALPNSERATGHRIENALKLYFHGKITRNQMLNLFNIPAGMEADFDQFKTRFDGFSLLTILGLRDQQAYVDDLEACVIALQLGDITKAQFNTFTGLSLSTV